MDAIRSGLNVSDNRVPPMSCPVCGLHAAPAASAGLIHVCQNCGAPLVVAPNGDARRAGTPDLDQLSAEDRARLEASSATILKMLRR